MEEFFNELKWALAKYKVQADGFYKEIS